MRRDAEIHLDTQAKNLRVRPFVGSASVPPRRCRSTPWVPCRIRRARGRSVGMSWRALMRRRPGGRHPGRERSPGGQSRLSLVRRAVWRPGARPRQSARLRSFPGGSTTGIPTRRIRCRCGCARPAAWHSSSASRSWPRSRSVLSRMHSWRKPSTRSSGLLPLGGSTGRSRVVEFASPHGGSWLGPLAERGMDAGYRRRTRGSGHRLLRHDARP